MCIAEKATWDQKEPVGTRRARAAAVSSGPARMNELPTSMLTPCHTASQNTTDPMRARALDPEDGASVVVLLSTAITRSLC